MRNDFEQKEILPGYIVHAKPFAVGVAIYDSISFGYGAKEARYIIPKDRELFIVQSANEHILTLISEDLTICYAMTSNMMPIV